MRVSVSPARLDASPGVPQQVAITITNPGGVIGGYAVRLLGADPTWVSLEEQRISLFPEESRTIVATVTVPPGLVAGERRMAVQVRELTPPEASTVEELVILVPEAPAAEVRVDPLAQTTGRTGRFTVLVDNTGNTPVRGWLAGADSEGKVRYRFDPGQVDLAPGEHAVVDVRVRGRRPFIGQPVARVLDLHLAEGAAPPPAGRRGHAPPPPDPEAPPAATATMVQTAVLSRGPIGLVGLLAAITVFAIVITIALSRLVGQSAADRNLALEIAANEGSSSQGGNSGVSGTVRLLTSGRPVPGVAVNVYAAEDLVTPLASVATGDGGGYQVGGLPAGDYKLTFRGAGFEPLWYPRSADAENAETVTVDDNNRVAGLDVALGGAPASIAGKVVGEDVEDATVTLRTPSSTAPTSGAVVTAPGAGGATDAADAADDGAIVQTESVGGDGEFVFGDVPSPSVYDLVVTKEGYATSTQRVDVSAGEEREGVEINLVQGNGIISGEVVSGGQPLDGVTITATSGQTSVSTVSLSAGDKGGFTLRRLPTPATYTLVASKEGYASQTVSLTLADGQALTGVSLSLGAASGSIKGTATLAGGGPAGGPVGGVTVTVTDGVETVQTATQSSGDVGSWKVSGLAVPGTFTVTFARPDLESQTVSVTLDATGAIAPSSIGTNVTSEGIATVLRSATAVVEGVVRQRVGDTRPRAGEVTVTLTSGPSSYSVVTASVPSQRLGHYRIEGVPPGTYTVSVARRGIRPTSALLDLSAGEKVTHSPVLPEASSLDGLVHEDGEPVPAGYLVELYVASDYPNVVYRETRTTALNSERKNYLFEDIDAPETYVIQIRRAPGTAPIGSATVTVGESDDAGRDVEVSTLD